MGKTGKILLIALFVVNLGIAGSAEVRSQQVKYALNVDAICPTIGVEGIDASIEDWMDDVVNRAIRGVAGMAFGLEDEEAVDEIQTRYEIRQASERMLTVVLKTHVSPFKAAHGTTTVDTMTFDLATGDVMFLDDYFKNPEKAVEIMASLTQSVLNADLRKTMPDQFPNGLDEDDGSWFKEGFSADKANFGEFVIEPDGMKIIFQQYQVLPYAFGIPEAFFSLDELAPAEPKYEYWGKTKSQ